MVGGILNAATNAGRYYRQTNPANRGVLDFIEQHHSGALDRPGDPVIIPRDRILPRMDIRDRVVAAVPEGDITFDDVMARQQAARDEFANQYRNPPPSPVLENQSAPAANPGALANVQPTNRRDQTPMSFRPQTIGEDEMFIRTGLAGLGANMQGATASMGAMGDMYGAVQDKNRSTLNAYDIAMEKAKAKAAAKDKGKKTGSAGDLYGSIVVNDAIDRGLPMIDNFTAGLGGTMLSKIPGTAATDLTKLIDSVKANAGFDKLQAMREASPTGGALGQVSDKEIRFLQSVFGSLDQDQSPNQLRYNLELFRYVYNSMIHGEGNHPYAPPAGSEAMINQMRTAMGKPPIASSQPAGTYSAEDQALIDKYQ